MNEPMILVSSIYLAVSVINFILVCIISFVIYRNLKIHYEKHNRKPSGDDIYAYSSAFLIVAVVGFSPVVNIILLLRSINEMKNLNPLIKFFVELADYNIYDSDWDTK